MSTKLDPEQRRKIRKEHRRGYEAMAIFAVLSMLIVIFFLREIYVFIF